MTAVLFVCCPEDASTRYGYYYLRNLANSLTKHFKVVFLKTANLTNLHAALIKYDPRLVVFNGHGGMKGFKGCNGNVILGVKTYDSDFEMKIYRENPEWMKGRIVYLFTCNTGKELAPRLVRAGALAVVAFDRRFFFVTSNKEVPPDKDSYPFFCSALQFIMALSENKTVKESFQDLKNSFIYYTGVMEQEGNVLSAKYLYYNYCHARLFGDGRVKL